MIKFVRFIAAFLTYAIIDIVWHLFPFVTAMYVNLREASGLGNEWSFGKEMDTWGGFEFLALLVFFLLMGLANSHLAIEPALRKIAYERRC